MNNKGQVLVCFIILFPILLMIFALIIDLGYMKIKTYKIKDSVKEAITYGLTNNDIEGVKKLLEKNNIEGYSIKENNNIEITVDGSYKLILGNFFDKDIYKYKFKYIGFIDNDELIIKEG